MQAVWLAAGCKPVQIALRDDQVSVQAGVLHGHYHGNEDKKTGRKHLVIALCTDQRSVLDFGHQMPYNMNVVPDGAFRSMMSQHQRHRGLHMMRMASCDGSKTLSTCTLESPRPVFA